MIENFHFDWFWSKEKKNTFECFFSFLLFLRKKTLNDSLFWQCQAPRQNEHVPKFYPCLNLFFLSFKSDRKQKFNAELNIKMIFRKWKEDETNFTISKNKSTTKGNIKWKKLCVKTIDIVKLIFCQIEKSLQMLISISILLFVRHVFYLLPKKRMINWWWILLGKYEMICRLFYPLHLFHSHLPFTLQAVGSAKQRLDVVGSVSHTLSFSLTNTHTHTYTHTLHLSLSLTHTTHTHTNLLSLSFSYEHTILYITGSVPYNQSHEYCTRLLPPVPLFLSLTHTHTHAHSFPLLILPCENFPLGLLSERQEHFSQTHKHNLYTHAWITQCSNRHIHSLSYTHTHSKASTYSSHCKWSI